MRNLRTYILNLDYSILCAVDWQKGMILFFKGHLIPTEWYDDTVTSAGGVEYRIPKCLMVKKYVKSSRRFLPTRKNILKRDDYTCQYCGDTRMKDLTLDHILPRSRKGKDTWENLVCACYKCNSKKANKTPVEAGMKLLRKPYDPKGYII